jgi:hypothetical protein
MTSKRISPRSRLVVLAALVALVAAVSADAATPTNTSPPAISGTAQVGQTLTASPGSWSGSKDFNYAYQWRQCNNVGGACGAISGATSNTYKLGSGDVGHTVRVIVTATNMDGSGTAQSAPTGVVQPAPTPPKVTSIPTIGGRTVQGEVLTANNGTWSGTNPMAFVFRWRRCDSNGNNCAGTGVTTQTYTLGGADVGHTMRVLVTATNSAGSSSAVSAQTSVVQATPTPPKVTSIPTIAGRTVQGEVLTANNGNWSGTTPMTFAFRWQRCDSNGNNCVNTGVTTQTYRLGGADVGRTMRVLVTATNSVGSSSAVSARTSVVRAAAAPPPPTGCVSISAVNSPQRLVVDQITSSPSRIQRRDEPLVMRFHVISTTGRCVSGALVYGVGVPFDRLSKESEVQTGGDGWATINFQILPTFRLRSGNLVVVFVRARQGGESLLAGVSTRRLVSVRVA